MTRLVRQTFRSLRLRNYRLYFAGQVVSLSGTWMQGLAQSWLVLQLTGSGTLLGLTTALQFAPLLVLGPLGGVLADRVDKRKLLVVTQALAGLLAFTLAALTATGVVRLWMVLVLALAFGLFMAVDHPTRQSFLHEMVGGDDMPNAVTLNSVVANVARVLGPGVGGLLIASMGTALCFLFNGFSYLAVIVALLLMKPAELFRDDAVRPKARLREGLAYVWRTPELRVPLIVIAVVGGLGYEFPIILPLLARYTFNGDAALFGTMTALLGVGAILGGLATATRKPPTPAWLAGATLAFGAVLLAVAVAPNLGVTLVFLVAAGASSMLFIATSNATIQLRAAPAMRGRVMALWGVALLGTVPLGGPLVGWVGETFGARWALALGGCATLAAGLYAVRALHLWTPARAARTADTITGAPEAGVPPDPRIAA